MRNDIGFQGLSAYKTSVEIASSIFRMTSSFPKEERYSLTDQIRRSSRAVGANIAESYAKRRYPKHFISKLTDAAGENNETQCWLEHARQANYLSDEAYRAYIARTEEVARLLNYMINNPAKFNRTK